MEKVERLLKPSEVAKMLNVGHRTVDRWCREGIIKCIKLPSGVYRIPESEVRRIVRELLRDQEELSNSS